MMRRTKNEDHFDIVEDHYFTTTELEKSSAIWPVRLGMDISKTSCHVGPKAVPYFYFIFVLEGQAEFIYKEKSYRVQKSDLFCFFPHLVHEYYTDQEHPLQKVWIAFEGPKSLALLERIGIDLSKPFIANAISEEILELISNLFSIVNDHSKEGSDLARLITLHQIFEELSRNKSSVLRNFVCSDYWLQQGKDYIEMHYCERVTIEQIAEHVGVDRAHFSRKFHSTFLISPAKYLQTLKINEAKRLLEQTTYNLSIIAQSIGYTDISTFSKAFKKTAGIPPREYRFLHQSRQEIRTANA
ncbi:AraC family transcriptional regulator [Paenibacillus sp. CMAA1739]|uniref:AraC family transcriptional regulator n=1 Tax=Paenibacillus ottowii TaxID=2315729 RepID=UPI00273192CF|nr:MULTISPECIES: AraC family transcriptional regulator [Paenibacillus]MDP1510575.1 AraC family transcriptional regulator [Paenibacillus ottowii]MEC4565990.1 AraC family transcriptional regulator [Paenibacillus sp. CMAA1739]